MFCFCSGESLVFCQHHQLFALQTLLEAPKILPKVYLKTKSYSRNIISETAVDQRTWANMATVQALTFAEQD